MSEQIKEARSLFEEFEKTKDVDAFIQAMHIILELTESGSGRGRVIADNMFRVNWDSALKWVYHQMDPYKKEIETTMQKHIDQGRPPIMAKFLRFIEIADLNNAQKVDKLIAFMIEMMHEDKAPA